MAPPEPSTAPTVIVRPATAADLPRIGRLGALLVDAFYNIDAQRFLATRTRTPLDYASFLETQLARPEVAVLVADENGDVVGYAYAAIEGYDYMELRGPAGVIHDIFVDPQSRGRGVGRLLLQAALTFLRTRGAPRVVLTTAEGNEVAKRLFASAGFRWTMIEMTREMND